MSDYGETSARREAPSVTRILVVDDDAHVCEILCRYLEVEGYDCASAYNGEDAWETLQKKDIDLVVADIMMPGMSGTELLTRIETQMPDVAVVIVTAVDDRDIAVDALKLGAYGYVIKPFGQNEIVISVANALERRRLVMASRQYEGRLEERVREQTREIRTSREDIALRLMAAQQYHHDETGAHIRRLGLYAEVMSGSMGRSAEYAEMMRLAAPMHDVGKIGVPDAILLKPGKLSEDEFETMKSHTTIGGGILDGSEVPLVNLSRDIALRHHEKWDGSGYPGGLSGEDIPEAARMVAVLDVYDALVNERVYRPALSDPEALDILAKGKGSHFAPDVLDAFMKTLPELRRILSRFGDRATLRAGMAPA